MIVTFCDKLIWSHRSKICALYSELQIQFTELFFFLISEIHQSAPRLNTSTVQLFKGKIHICSDVLLFTFEDRGLGLERTCHTRSIRSKIVKVFMKLSHQFPHSHELPLIHLTCPPISPRYDTTFLIGLCIPVPSSPSHSLPGCPVLSALSFLLSHCRLTPFLPVLSLP